MHGFGPVKPEPNEPVFHAEWEKRAFALTLAMGMPGGWNIDMSRFARENRAAGRISVDELLPDLVRRRWRQCSSERELVAETKSTPDTRWHPPKPVKRILLARRRRKGAAIAAGRPSGRQTRTAAFKAGDKVRTKNINPLTHTRLPRYVRGHVGTIERVHRLPRFPDSNATGAGENPQWLYTVRFDGRELWGADGDPTVKVSVDAWEPYLEAGVMGIDPQAAMRAAHRSAGHPARCRRAGIPRAMGGAGLRHDAGAA